MVGGGAKGLEFRSWCEKCLGSGRVPLPVARGCRGCLDNGHEYLDDQRGTVRISTKQCLVARPGFQGCFQVLHTGGVRKLVLPSLLFGLLWIDQLALHSFDQVVELPIVRLV